MRGGASGKSGVSRDQWDDDGRFLEREGRRWYRTGDRVRCVEGGELTCLDRLDGEDQVQGRRVEPAEVDNALRGCVGVDEAVTVVASAAGVDQLVVLCSGVPAHPAQLAKELGRVLPQGLVPKYYEHVTASTLNSNLKIDRTVLRSRAKELIGALK